jgi:D-alanyl-D-alanine carboxypeptidase/D-alanyl-D-alanine-endopeptidase (penicillin-binding protein 4)
MKQIRRNTIAFFVLLLWFTIAQETSANLATSIDALLVDPALKHGTQGVVIESLATGRILYERNRDILFIPASNLKLLVSAASLDKLGPDFTFATRIYRSGKFDASGILKGDIVIVGGGDPVLSTNDLRAMVKEIRNKGIRRIDGNIIADDSRFDEERLGNGWPTSEEPFYYSAQISALTLDRNVVDVYVRPGLKVGDSVKVSLRPSSDYFTIENVAKTGPAGSDNTVYIDRVRGKNIILVKGSIPIDSKSTSRTEPITMEEPTLYTAVVLKDVLIKSGIKVTGKVIKGVKPDVAKLVVEHKSPPLSNIIILLNKPSDNLIAENLLKSLGAEVKGKGTISTGEEVELDFLKRAGGDPEAITINDGSGLSRLNYISPDNLIAILRFMWNHRYSKVFIDSLPIAGVDGTLRRRMKGTASEGNVRAKTGYVRRVSCLSGYVTTRTKEPIVFSIMMNGHLCSNSSATKIQDAICELLANLEESE